MTQKNKTETFDTYADAVSFLSELLSKRRVDLSVKHLVLVPEKYTLLVENSLLKKTEGAFDVDVTSFSRLYAKLVGAFALPKEGAVIILKQILNGMQLDVYGRAKSKRGFCERLYKELAGLISCGVTPEMLAGLDGGGAAIPTALKCKIGDIAKVYKEFLNRTSGVVVDRHGKLSALKKRLTEADYFKNSHVYVLNFDYTTKLEEEIFDCAGAGALSFWRGAASAAPAARRKGQASKDKGFANKNREPDDGRRNVEIYSAINAAGMVKAAAKRIRLAAVKGIGYNEIALVCHSQSFKLIERIFTEYKIPVSIGAGSRLRADPLAQYLLTLFDLNRPNRRGFVALSKNLHCRIPLDDACVFENYANRFLIDYTGFFRPFTIVDDTADAVREKEKMQTAERVRQKLAVAHERFWGGIKKAGTAAEFAKAVEMFLAAAPDSHAKARITELVNLTKRTFEGKHTASIFIEALVESIETSALSLLPKTAFCVQVSDPSAFRGGEFEYTLILDLNEGVIPPVSAEEGVFTGADMAALKTAGIEPNLTAADKAKSHIKELLCLMRCSKRLFLSYIRSEQLRPSPFLRSIEPDGSEYGKIKINSQQAESERVSDVQTPDDFLAFYAGGKEAALEYVLLTKCSPTALTSAAYSLLKSEADKFFITEEGDAALSGMDAKVCEWLFFKKNTTSATQLQAYYQCPYRHFVRFGLRAQRALTGEVSALDTGFIIHKIAEQFVKGGFCGKVLDKALDAPWGYKFELEENAALREKLKRQIKKLCLRFESHIRTGEFKIMGAEIRLDSPALKPVLLDGVRLSGQVDYADEWKNFVRIIDYKSSKTEFDKTDFERGLQLQLPLYMLAFKNSGFTPAGFLFFPFRNRWADRENKFTGIFNACGTVASAMGQDGEKEIADQKGARSLEQIEEILEQAQQMSSHAVKQIKKGDISRAPAAFSKSRRGACYYCEYKPACCCLLGGGGGVK